MAMDPRSALERLMAALEEHHNAAAAADDPYARRVVDASNTLSEAFITYDDALFTSYGADLPFELYDDDDDDDDGYDDDFDDLEGFDDPTSDDTDRIRN